MPVKILTPIDHYIALIVLVIRLYFLSEKKLIVK